MATGHHSAAGWQVYQGFQEIDGTHPYRTAVPAGHVDYRARRLHGSTVVYFNFALAREMGLIAAGHPGRLNPRLSRAILDAFSLVIINEYDQLHRLRVPPRDILPGSFMATRYLQLQHQDRTGRTSGDGRSIWNGTFSSAGVTWDLSSCGTGVTRLCPATAEAGRFFKTGSRAASYGCGTASLDEGLEAALLSEVLHRNGVSSERVLAVIGLASGHAIKVRAGRNLLRPSHFFLFARQNDLESLRGAVDCFLDRQAANGDFPCLRQPRRRYRRMAEDMALTFARVTATFESEYIFCWLEWDGDNILADGGIIDYGSVRQFGLYHREYRFDDGPRMSTTLPEQRRKARGIVRGFAQIRDYLITGRKRPLTSYDQDEVLKLFDAEFAAARDRLLLRNFGFPEDMQRRLLADHGPAVRRFRRAHAYFERARSARGPVPVPDGITWNAIFSTRDLLRELPRCYLVQPQPIAARAFIDLAASTYASRCDRVLTPHRRRMAGQFQRAYLDLVARAAASRRASLGQVLEVVESRSASLNRYARLTGDGATHASLMLARRRRELDISRLVEAFVSSQVLLPGKVTGGPRPAPEERRVLEEMERLLAEHRHGL